MASDLPGLERALRGFLSDLEPVQHAMGQAGKRAALEQLQRALGNDRVMSGFKRRVALGAGYDLGSPVILNMRPKGLVILADKGRKRTKRIRPGRGEVVVKTPYGPKAWSTSTPSRGLDVVARTVRQCDDDVPRAVSAEVGRAIDRTF